VRELEHRRCTYVVRELVHLHDVLAVGGYRNHHDGRDLALHLYMCVGRESVLSHHDEHVGHGLVLHRCTCEVRELDAHLHNGHLIRLAFRHPCAVVYRKDSKHHCCALRHVLQRAVILLCCGHLDRVVRVVRGIRLLPP
jgi:hypothetical protein